MKQGTFEHEIFIEAEPKKIVDFLVEHTNHPRFHPLIMAVKETIPPPPGVLRRFMITDQLVWGPFHFKITYRADVLKATANEMLTEAYQSPGTYVTNHSTFMAEGKGSRLHETITLKAPNLLFNYAFEQARSSHAELVAQLKQVLETEK
ncbi:MAG: SRPBCC family protein [Chloroflexi bacterium]|nr:SRPBCC family protein [Chloroflexota bacterium]MBI3340923.1 SRPBCC family protein [Chloroflexota bacterium]